MYKYILSVAFLLNLVQCRDFYIGMFQKNDFLVAQDRLYKDRHPYGYMYAKYGRSFKCPITYIRIVDRLGVGNGPHVDIVRGGLQKKLVVLRLRSLFNYPISVNVYVGCRNKIKPTKATIKPTAKAHDSKNATAAHANGATNQSSDNGTTNADGPDGTAAAGVATTVAGGAEDNGAATTVAPAA